MLYCSMTSTSIFPIKFHLFFHLSLTQFYGGIQLILFYFIFAMVLFCTTSRFKALRLSAQLEFSAFVGFGSCGLFEI